MSSSGLAVYLEPIAELVNNLDTGLPGGSDIFLAENHW